MLADKKTEIAKNANLTLSVGVLDGNWHKSVPHEYLFLGKSRYLPTRILPRGGSVSLVPSG